MEYAPTLEEQLQLFPTCAPGEISQLVSTTIVTANDIFTLHAAYLR